MKRTLIASSSGATGSSSDKLNDHNFDPNAFNIQHPVLDAIGTGMATALPSAIAFGPMGIPAGAFIGVANGINKFNKDRAEKGAGEAFSNTKQALLNNIPQDLQDKINPFVSGASSYNDLDRINKTYMPMIGNLNQSAHNSNYANTGDNTYANGYYDPAHQQFVGSGL